MNDYRSRLINESSQLKERLIKLCEFIDSGKIRNLDKRDQDLLLAQKRAMITYKDILEERLSRF